MRISTRELPKNLLPENRACRLIGVSQKTMARWRAAGTAPPHYQLSEKIIRYDEDALVRWFQEQAA